MSINEVLKLISNVYIPSEYSKIREQAYSLISNYKSPRYVKVDDRVTVLFEDAATVWFQIEETVYLESTDDPSVLKEAIKTYSPMIPSKDEISITLFVHIYNYDELRNLLPKYNGIHDAVELGIGDLVLKAVPIYPEDYGPNAQPRSIHYLKVRHAQLKESLNRADHLTLTIKHPMVNKSVTISGETLNAVKSSITSESIAWATR